MKETLRKMRKVKKISRFEKDNFSMYVLTYCSWNMGQWIVAVREFQKIIGLFVYGLKHHIVEKRFDLTYKNKRLDLEIKPNL